MEQGSKGAMDSELENKMHEVTTTNSLPQLGKKATDVNFGLIFSALSNAQSELRRVEKKWQSTETAMQDDINMLSTELDDERGIRFVLQERVSKVAALERERDAALAAAEESRKKENREVAFILARARRDRKRTLQAFDAIVTTLQGQHQKLEAQSTEFKRVANAQLIAREIQQVTLVRELECTRTLVQHTKNKLWIVEVQRDQLKRERDDAALALDAKSAKVAEECDAKLKLEELLTAAEWEKRRLELDLNDAREQVVCKKRKTEKTHQTNLRMARRESKELKAELLKVASHNLKLKETCSELETARQALQTNLEEESEKSLCQICYESPKDSIAFPCLHLSFCFSCLELHRAQKKTCPMCRTAISGVLKCVIGV